jgi:hypothetical protein
MIRGCEASLQGNSSDDDTTAAANFCYGVTQGVSQLMWWNCLSREDGFAADPLLTAGLPPSAGAAMQAWLNWARANPAKWNERFELSLIWALAEAFPCQS